MVTPQEQEKRPTQLPFSESARKVLDLTQKEAQARNNSVIGTEHLFLGLMQDPTIKKALVQSWIERVSLSLRMGPETNSPLKEFIQKYSINTISERIETFAHLLSMYDTQYGNLLLTIERHSSADEVKNVIAFADNNAKASNQQKITPIDLLTGFIAETDDDKKPASLGLRLLEIHKSDLPKLVNTYNTLSE